jgi:hypothetical protein
MTYVYVSFCDLFFVFVLSLMINNSLTAISWFELVSDANDVINTA